MANRVDYLRARSRTIRDPIHGTIELSPLQAAVVDTRHFQRLRYIRQNGLLHFVFPGAVHTRFVHSLGAMYLAGRAFRQITKPIEQETDAKLRKSLDYLGTVFQLAALLHDVGHCAFSHSIEKVKADGKPFLGTIREFFENWQEPELLNELCTVAEDSETFLNKPIHHEEIGYVLIRRIFTQPNVKYFCNGKADDFAKDIVALIHGDLTNSASFDSAGQVVYRWLSEKQNERTPSRGEAAGQMLRVMHNLISGTLDVDRLDYLVRDSRFCGVSYGVCDVDFLINSLRISFIEGEAVLAISRKAENALEDMLWSRYQLFVQVLNHKTNVGLNSALQQALEDALNDLRITQPKDEPSLLGFTDDYVMSNIHQAALTGKLDKKSYTKALIDRRLPFHLGQLDLLEKGNDTKKAQDAKRQELATKHHLRPEDIFCATAKSELVKAGHMFTVSPDRLTGKYETSPLQYSTLKTHLKHSLLHFFCDRDKLPVEATQEVTNERTNPPRKNRSIRSTNRRRKVTRGK